MVYARVLRPVWVQVVTILCKVLLVLFIFLLPTEEEIKVAKDSQNVNKTGGVQQCQIVDCELATLNAPQAIKKINQRDEPLTQ